MKRHSIVSMKHRSVVVFQRSFNSAYSTPCSVSRNVFLVSFSVKLPRIFPNPISPGGPSFFMIPGSHLYIFYNDPRCDREAGDTGTIFSHLQGNELQNQGRPSLNPAIGFYLWETVSKGKSPGRVHPPLFGMPPEMIALSFFFARALNRKKALYFPIEPVLCFIV